MLIITLAAAGAAKGKQHFGTPGLIVGLLLGIAAGWLAAWWVTTTFLDF